MSIKANPTLNGISIPLYLDYKRKRNRTLKLQIWCLLALMRNWGFAKFWSTQVVFKMKVISTRKWCSLYFYTVIPFNGVVPGSATEWRETSLEWGRPGVRGKVRRKWWAILVLQLSPRKLGELSFRAAHCVGLENVLVWVCRGFHNVWHSGDSVCCEQVSRSGWGIALELYYMKEGQKSSELGDAIRLIKDSAWHELYACPKE